MGNFEGAQRSAECKNRKKRKERKKENNKDKIIKTKEGEGKERVFLSETKQRKR